MCYKYWHYLSFFVGKWVMRIEWVKKKIPIKKRFCVQFYFAFKKKINQFHWFLFLDCFEYFVVNASQKSNLFKKKISQGNGNKTKPTFGFQWKKIHSGNILIAHTEHNWFSVKVRIKETSLHLFIIYRDLFWCLFLIFSGYLQTLPY